MKRLLTLGAATLVALAAGCQPAPTRTQPQARQEAYTANPEPASFCEIEPQYVTGTVLREEFHSNYALLVGTSEGNYALEVTGNASSLALMIDEGDAVRFRAGYMVTNAPCRQVGVGYSWVVKADMFVPELPENRRGEISDNYIELVEKAH